MILTQNAGHIDPKFIEATGKDSEGYLSRSPFAPDLVEKNPVAKALNPGYKARAGKDLYDFPARAFTGITTLVDAINRAGSTEPEAIRVALTKTDVKGAGTSSCPGPASSSTRRARTRACARSSSSSRGRQSMDGLAVRGGGARRPLPDPEVVGAEVDLGHPVSVRVGIDVGGTFTDLVAVESGTGAVRSRKVLTTPDAPARGVLAGLQALAPDASSIAHGTTIVTNAIVEGRHARTALVTTRGFRDALEIARQSRQEPTGSISRPGCRRSCPATSGSR